MCACKQRCSLWCDALTFVSAVCTELIIIARVRLMAAPASHICPCCLYWTDNYCPSKVNVNASLSNLHICPCCLYWTDNYCLSKVNVSASLSHFSVFVRSKISHLSGEKKRVAGELKTVAQVQFNVSASLSTSFRVGCLMPPLLQKKKEISAGVGNSFLLYITFHVK